MTAINKWIAKHKTLTWVLLSVAEILAYTSWLLELGWPKWSIILVDAGLILLNYLFASTAPTQLQRKPLLALTKDGDPDPLLAITQELLTFRHPETYRQTLLINYCVALRERGELEKMCSILQSINIDKSPQTLPWIKVVYYNNLSDAYTLLGDDVQAQIWYEKMMQIYRDMPENKVKRSLENASILAQAEDCMRCGNYPRAMQLVTALKPEKLTEKMSVALLYAQIEIKKGNAEAARQSLHYVINTGNKLYAVKLAQKLLDELDAPKPKEQP